MFPVVYPLSDSHFKKDLKPQYKAFIKTIATEYANRLPKSVVGLNVEISTTDQTQVRINVLN